MDMSSLFRVLGQIAGIGGLALGVLLLVYGQILRKDIFPTLTKKSSYLLLRQMVRTTFGISALGVGAWTLTTLLSAEGLIAIETTEYMGDVQIVHGDVVLQQIGEMGGQPVDPETRAIVERASRLVSEGLYAEALAVYRDLADRSAIPAVQNNLGALLALNGELEEARRALARAAQGEGEESSAARVNLALVEMREGRVEGALETLTTGEETPEMRRLVSRIADERRAGAIESEPNDEIEGANVLPLGNAVRGSVSDGRDVFRVDLPTGPADWVDVRLRALSSTLRPEMYVYDSGGREVTTRYGTTAGQDLALSFVGSGGRAYYVATQPWTGEGGGYELTVTARNARDGMEPNDSILAPTDLGAARSVEANIHYGGDVDFYRFSGLAGGSIRVRLTNRSSALRPDVHVFNALKREVRNVYGTTEGEDLLFSADVPPGEEFFVSVRSWLGSVDGPAPYTLGIEGG